ncbi:PP2C family protein-serine/threonine phosphatase [Streptomyces caniscabiei]|uniref:Serine/threonine-protein phosphatase n=1 Tax=Streptomyces caniscabiei TaxID=2746961 RepID=A0A927L8Q0_9ACTN|nr:PP2C family protein-serine/threonine phosphatase [Streptomyces caniscabiei]MBD9727427.1 serine/threonine-protein phosphatase [Streptomyces caniscabiei]MDX3512685.1 PP2C family protein-serine/threonine phosphatase [Streptomyces caniscabiei]MDX3722210.1 PP2C family protein-serine/threonine phosphatase [Streptomyces caniscabiei]WEO28809.1 PP2C family protein-serine/threonine phosphatase [Streptomyces caniscabiei]
MSHTRELGGDHGPIRPSRRRPAARGTAARNRIAAQLASGTPVLPVLPALPVLIVSAVVVVGLFGGAGLTWLPLLAAGPALAATTSGPGGVLCVGLLAGVAGTTLGVREGAPGRELAAVLSALAAVTLASGLAGALRGRRERVLAAVRSVAEAAQHALLQPVPAVVGPFQVAVRYSAAAAEARIGGDLYALVPTPYGVRLIVGDVRGKGLPAVGVAALVVGVFREAAYEEPDLLAVVDRIERSLARNLRCDDFVTAVVAGHPEPDRLELVNCGHAPPLLVHGDDVVPVEPARPAPPLGLRALSGETPALQTLPFADGDQLLLYTDGVTEARDRDREFYPLTQRLAHHLSEEPAHTLTGLHDELLKHVGGRLHDDAALLLLRKPPTPAPATRATPAAPAAVLGPGTRSRRP